MMKTCNVIICSLWQGEDNPAYFYSFSVTVYTSGLFSREVPKFSHQFYTNIRVAPETSADGRRY